MKTLLREMVSGNKFRYKDDYYNLDLTYITPRIIAMSLPAEGIISSTYRNELSEVAQFLHEHHGENYLVVNLSMKKYNYEKFRSNVIDFDWVDHHSPYLPIIFDACKQMHEFLEKNKENIVVVHCIAGKGRTGSLISAYMLYVGAFHDKKQAIAYYKEKRKVGVTHPGQIRYIHYLQDILKNGPEAYKPKMRRLRCIRFHSIPNLNNGSCRPQIDIYNVRDNQKIFQKKFDDLKKLLLHPIKSDREEAELVFDTPVFLFGDTFIKFTQINTLSSKKMFRLAFNSNLVDNSFTFDLEDLDPDTISKDPAFKGFKVTFYLEDIEDHSNSSELANQQIGYRVIEESIKYRANNLKSSFYTQLNVFGDPDFDDRDEMMILNKDNLEASEMSGEEV